MRDSDGALFSIIVVCIVGIVAVLGLVLGVDKNGFSCPAGSQTVWEDDKAEIEGCILPGGTWLDDPN